MPGDGLAFWFAGLETDGERMAELRVLVDEYLAFVFQSDPIQATRMGVHEYDHLLGELAPEAVAEVAAKRKAFLCRFRAVDARALCAEERMDLEVAIIDLETALHRGQDQRVWERAPYWYVERLGGALSDLMRGLPAEEQGRRLLSRLQLSPAYLAAARANLSEQSPPIYVEMGLTAARGLGQFLEQAVPGFAAGLSAALEADLRRAVAGLQEALADLRGFLRDLGSRARGHFACGADHFDFLLQQFHLLDMDHASLYEFGLERVAADKARLEAYAREQDADLSWMEQIDRVKEDHPRAGEFLDSYGQEMILARQHCVEQDLITLPEGEVCRVLWLPSYLRAGAPLGLMRTTPPFEVGLESALLLTPVDADAPSERREQHMRDNNYAFARSITLHEIYPGHHLQQVHHKLATRNSPMRRYFSSPVFVEGWGLYTEDLLEETGFIDEPAVMLFKLRNALWRSVRVVVDTGLHTRGMRIDEAVRLLQEEVCLDAHMAEGEVRRYTTHDNPTYPSSYLAGKTLIQELREAWRRRQGQAYSLKAFHDRLLGYGSPPVKLVAERMLSEG